jgi:hypothetical protein
MNRRLQDLKGAFPDTRWRTILRTDGAVPETLSVFECDPKAGSVYADKPTPPTEYFLRVGLERRRLIKQSKLWSECIDIWK